MSKTAETQPETRPEVQTDQRRLYIKPEITHELDLETRAGSPLGAPDPLDLLP